MRCLNQGYIAEWAVGSDRTVQRSFWKSRYDLTLKNLKFNAYKWKMFQNFTLKFCYHKKIIILCKCDRTMQTWDLCKISAKFSFALAFRETWGTFLLKPKIYRVDKFALEEFTKFPFKTRSVNSRIYIYYLYEYLIRTFTEALLVRSLKGTGVVSTSHLQAAIESVSFSYALQLKT